MSPSELVSDAALQMWRSSLEWLLVGARIPKGGFNPPWWAPVCLPCCLEVQPCAVLRPLQRREMPRAQGFPGKLPG